MNICVHIYNSGDEVVSRTDREEVESVLAKIRWRLYGKCASRLRADILGGLQAFGWSDQVRIRSSHGLTLTSVKNKTGLCLQTGNMARIYADLLKLQAQYVDKKIDAAIYVLPKLKSAKLMGSNIANFERLTRELELYQSFITIPMLVVGFSQDDN